MSPSTYYCLKNPQTSLKNPDRGEVSVLPFLPSHIGRDPFNKTSDNFGPKLNRFGPAGKVSKNLVHILRWTTFPVRTGLNFGWMDRAHSL